MKDYQYKRGVTVNIDAPLNLPLPTHRYYYVGKDNEYFIQGESYFAVETGYHWKKEWGYVIWIASEENKHTKDIDYCIAFDFELFNKEFKRY